MSGITAVGLFLVSLFFSLVIFSLWLRIALRYLKISSLNSFSQMIYSVTDVYIKPVNELLKITYKPGTLYDWTALGVLVIIEFLKIICVSLLTFHTLIPFSLIVVYVIADLIVQPCDILFYAILFRVIMSYANPGWRHPIADFLRALTEPLLILGRRLVPDISGFDFSPFVVMVILKIISLFINASLPWRLL